MQQPVTLGEFGPDEKDLITKSFWADGLAVVRGLVSAEDIKLGNEEAYAIVNDESRVFEFNWRTPVRKQSNGTWYVEKIDPISDISDHFRSLICSQSIHNICASIFETDQFSCFKDKFIFKRPGQDGYPLHQDYNWWHEYKPEKILTIAIAFDHCDEQSGAIEFFPGQHSRMLLSEGRYSSLDDGAEEMLLSAESVTPNLEPGDAIIFHSLTPHCSGRNFSSNPRRLFYPSFIAGSDSSVYWDHYERQWARMSERLPSQLRQRMCFI